MHPVEQGVVGFRHPDFGVVPLRPQSLLLNENADVSIYVAVPIERQAVHGPDQITPLLYQSNP